MGDLPPDARQEEDETKAPGEAGVSGPLTDEAGVSAPSAEAGPAGDQDAELLQTIDAIDYSAYQSPELRASIESILSVPGTLVFFLRVAGLSFPLCELLITWAFRDKGWLTFGAAVVAGLFASFIFAVLLGITLCLRRILREIVKVIDKTLDIVGTVISDLGATGDRGSTQTIACVFGGVSRNLVLPIMESVVRAQLGFFGRPLLWVYRRVFVKTVDAATNRILLAATKIQVPGRERLAPVSEAVTTKIKSGAVTADWALATIRPYVVGGSRALSLAVLLPAWVVLGMASFVMAALFWWAHAAT